MEFHARTREARVSRDFWRRQLVRYFGIRCFIKNFYMDHLIFVWRCCEDCSRCRESKRVTITTAWAILLSLTTQENRLSQTQSTGGSIFRSPRQEVWATIQFSSALPRRKNASRFGITGIYAFSLGSAVEICCLSFLNDAMRAIAPQLVAVNVTFVPP